MFLEFNFINTQSLLFMSHFVHVFIYHISITLFTFVMPIYINGVVSLKKNTSWTTLIIF